MKLSIQGIEIEVPSHAQVSVSEDGKRVSVEIPDSHQMTEKIRVVEVPSDRVVEKIRVVEVEKPCTRPHSDWYYYYPPSYPHTVPSSTIITTTTPTWVSGTQTVSGDISGAQTVSGGVIYGAQTACDNQMPESGIFTS